ncbi:MAG TPA: S53 family peptidase [Streptosporangiaceae bacterium]|jgi:subtilase family serine protease
MVLTVLGGLAASITPSNAATAAPVITRPVGPAPVIPRQASLVGQTPESHALHIDIVLKPRDPSALNALALAVSTPGSPERGRFLTTRQFAARFGQPARVIKAADATLREVGLAPGRATANGLVIPVSTTVGQAEASLMVQLADYRLASGRVAFANTSAPRLPAALARVTTAVIGLNNLATPVTSPLTGASRSAASPATGPRAAAAAHGPAACKSAVKAAVKDAGHTYSKLAAAYSISGLYKKGHRGAGTRIALFELDPWKSADITSFQNCYKTKVPISAVKVDGGAGSGAGAGEATLDIETAVALAPKSKLTVYDAPGSNYAKSAVDEYTKIFDSDSAQVLSVSYGLCESYVQSLSPGLIASENTLFEQAATEGTSVFVASGDTGSEGCLRANKSKALAVLDPASQPFVTSVGGTDLTSVGPPPKERVWNESTKSEGAGGGGISSVWAMPPWQSGPGVVGKHSSGTPCGAATGDCREVPDVAGSADPAHGYIVRWKGKWQAIGGTSAATPLWAALLADIESGTSPVQRSGFLNPLLYATAAAGKGSFHDITAGNNDYKRSHGGLYPATARYDMASGLGSPVATKLAADIAAKRSAIAFTDAPGTSAPPGHLGTYKAKKFKADSCTSGTNYGSVSGPTGKMTFNPDLTCEEVGDGWETWSNGYTGDVYWADGNVGGSTTVTLTLPAGTKAFYLYAEPDEFDTFDMEATAQNGTTSGPLQVYGESGAAYYGFYVNGSSADIKKITISCDDDFAVGEFGIAK